MYGIPSRFLREIPAALLHEVRPKVQVSRPMHANAPRRNLRHAVVDETPGIALGQNVTPAKFGSGIVTDIEGAGAHARVQVNRSEEHTSELQSLMRSSSAVFCLKKKTKQAPITHP